MKSILGQFRLSSALDEGKLAADLQPMARGEDAQEFAAGLASVDQHLRAARPTPRVPGSLHDAIMARVRDCEKTARRTSSALPRRTSWWAAPAWAAILVACFFMAAYFLRRPAVQPPAPKPQQDLAALPGEVISPLSDELENLHRDARNTANFLLASLPDVSTQPR